MSALLALLLTLGLSLHRNEPAHAQPGSAVLTGAPSRRGEEIRGVWFTSNDMDVLRDRTRMREVVKQLAALHFNTLYPVVWNGGIAYYPSAVSERFGLQDFQYRGLQGQDILKELIEAAHQEGLLVLPWFEFGFMVPPDSLLTRRQPGWLSRRRDGSATSISAAGQMSWLNPMHPEVQAMLTELILEIATTYDADGIQFDDHTSLPSDFGYDATTTALYERSTGQSPPANTADAAWLKWRADRISAFIARLATKLRQKRPGFLVSLSPNYHDFAYKRQLQDWLTWVRQGSVDEVVVQLYRPDVASFESELNRPEFSASRQRVPTAVGIFTGQRTQPVPIERVVGQAQAARRRGLGAAFFYYESLWEEAQEPASLRQQALDALYQQAEWRRPVALAPRLPLAAATAPALQRLHPPGAPALSRPATAAPTEVTAAPGPAAAAAPVTAPAPQASPVSGASGERSAPGAASSRPLVPELPAPPPLQDPFLPPLDPSWGPYNGAPAEPALMP